MAEAWDAKPPTEKELTIIKKTPIQEAWDNSAPTDEELRNLGEPEKFRDFPTQLKDLAVEQLPTIGMIGGGLLGQGLGTIPMAAEGAFLGEAARQYLTKEDLDPSKMTEQGLYAGATETGVKGLLGAGKWLGKTKLGQKIGSSLGTIGTKIGNALTGVSENEIKTYANKADEIKAMAKANDNSTALAADKIRSQFYKDIDTTRKTMNDNIKTTLQNSNKTVDATEAVQELVNASSKINKELYPEDIKQIEFLISKFENLGTKDKSGRVFLDVQNLNDLRRYLQEQASSAYRPSGQIFQLGTKAAQGAKTSGAVVRRILNEAEPGIAKANETLAELHNIEDMMNSNLISEGKPEAGLIAAGTRGNLRNVEHLKRLGKITNTNMLGEADKLAAMRTFGSPQLMAADTTGKSVGRMALGGGLGYLSGGEHPERAAIIGSLLASPAALKLAIDAARLGGGVASHPLSKTLGKGMTKGLLESYLNQGAEK